MPLFLGIDTSNYTTSLAVYDSDDNSVIQCKKLLPVKEGQLGLRQSDAVFHHTQQLPELVKELLGDIDCSKIDGIGVSVSPRNIEGSYMPCFTCGSGLAEILSAILKKKIYKTSHQVGHVLAALYSSDKLNLIRERFIAFHVSGGTTDCLLAGPSKENILTLTETGTSLDLKAGQAVDRVGVMLGMKFPCGKELEKLAEKSNSIYKIKPVLKDGNCCLSGIENQCRKMLQDGMEHFDIAKYCLTYIYAAVRSMFISAKDKYGELPCVFAGGVMSNKFIRNNLMEEFDNIYFAAPEFSCDNAVGTAIYAYLRSIE